MSDVRHEGLRLVSGHSMTGVSPVSVVRHKLPCITEVDLSGGHTLASTSITTSEPCLHPVDLTNMRMSMRSPPF